MAMSIQAGKVFHHTVTDNPVTNGQLLLINRMVGVALADGAIGETIAVALDGVFEVPCALTGAVVPGQAMGIDDSGNAVIANGAVYCIGHAWEAAAVSATSIEVKLAGGVIPPLSLDGYDISVFSPPGTVTNVEAAGAVTKGDLIITGRMAGVAAVTTTASGTIPILTEGVHAIAVASGVSGDIAVGAAVTYATESGKKVVTTTGSGYCVGYAWEDWKVANKATMPKASIKLTGGVMPIFE